MSLPIPSLALSNALLFADPTFDCLSGLGKAADDWRDAVVLSTPFWLPRTGKLNRPPDLEAENTSLVVASIRFDPDRELMISSESVSPDAVLDDAAKDVIATARRVRVLSCFPAAYIPALLGLMPSLTAVFLGTDEQLTVGMPALASLNGLRELHVTICSDLSELSTLAALPHLHKLCLNGCFYLKDLAALTSLTSLRELSLRGCLRGVDLTVIDGLPQLRMRSLEHAEYDPWEYHESTMPHQVPVDLLSTFADFLRSDDPDENMQGTLMIRKMLSVDHSPPVDKVIEHGCVPLFVAQLLRDEFPQLQCQSAWALTNIASEDGASVWCILGTPDAVPNLVRLLGSPDEDCCEQAAWAIGNLAGDGATARDVCLKYGALPGLITIITATGRKIATIRQAAWALSNLCRHKPLPRHEQVAPAFQILVDLLNHEDEELVVDAASTFIYLTDGAEDRIQQVLDTGCLPRLVELLGSNSSEVVMPAIRVLGNIATGNNQQDDALFENGLLSSFHTLLHRCKKVNFQGDSRSVRKEVYWAISNITSGSKDQIQAVFDANLIPMIVNGAKYPESRNVIREATRAVKNATCGGSGAQIDCLVEFGVLPCLCTLFAEYNPDTVSNALESVNNILNAGVRKQKENQLESNPYLDEIVKCGGLERIKKLEYYAEGNISELARVILDTHFDEYSDYCDESDEEQEASAATE